MHARDTAHVFTNSHPQVAAFRASYNALVSGATGMIPESELTPAAGRARRCQKMDRLAAVPRRAPRRDARTLFFLLLRRAGVPKLADVATGASADPALLARTVVLKLNGGLGTSMAWTTPSRC